MKKYDSNNVFAKILRKEIPAKIIFEDDSVLCFEDINKEAPIHWLVIPKKPCVDFYDFTANSSNEEVAIFFKIINKIISDNQIEKSGFKLLTNMGSNNGQSVFHFHVHIIAK